MIFLSYSWSDDELAEDIDQYFKTQNIELVRDRRDLDYRGNLKEFMSKIKISDYVIIIIGKKYLLSRNCMYEALETLKLIDFKERIIPIIKNDAEIFSIEGKLKYAEVWHQRILELEAKAKVIDLSTSIDFQEEIEHFKKIKNTVIEFLTQVSSFNNIVVKDKITKTDLEKINGYIFDQKAFPDTIIPRIWNEKNKVPDSYDFQFVSRLISMAFTKPPLEMNYDTFPVYSSIQAYVFDFTEMFGKDTHPNFTKDDIEKGISFGLLDSNQKMIKNQDSFGFSPGSGLGIYTSKKLVELTFTSPISLVVYTLTENALKILSTLWNNEHYANDVLAIKELSQHLSRFANLEVYNYKVQDTNGIREVKKIDKIKI
jgi:hypothetical protein